MIVCLDLPDTTCMVSATFVTESPIRSDNQDFTAIQALFDPRNIVDYKLEYEWDGNKVARTIITENGTYVNQ